MRNDMNKVIGETYRSGGRSIPKLGRQPRDVENFANREGIRRPYQAAWGRYMKETKENNTPMRRYLSKQVGRPWNLVYSEIRRTYDARNPLNNRILELVELFVTTRGLFVQDGQVLETSNYGAASPPNDLFVHPLTGLLCRAKGPSYMSSYRLAEARRQEEKDATIKIVSKTHKLVKVDENWFMVEYAPITAPLARCPESICRDVLTGEVFCEMFRHRNSRIKTYAKSKRQISHGEMKHFGIL
jgi:hypothetical protein